jgi:CHAD domain-containing protein
MPVDVKRGRSVFAKLEQDLSKLSPKLESDNVHGFRTGTRRLQVLFDLFAAPDRGQKKLLKQLGRIRKRAGKLRDLDVQLAALRGFKSSRQARPKTELVNHLIELRDRQEKKLRKLADGKTVRDLKKSLRRAAKKFDAQDSRDPLVAAREMLAKIDGSNPQVTEETLHRYRILAKQARYAAEFASQSPEREQFIARVKKVQDALGDWHDWLTLTGTAQKHLGDLRESPLVAELQNVSRAKFRRALASLTQMQPKRLIARKGPEAQSSSSSQSTSSPSEAASAEAAA